MGRSMVQLELAADSRIARDLGAGGVFVPACELAINEQCELVVRCSLREIHLDARVVYIDGQGGAGLELVGFGPAMKARLAAFVDPCEQAEEPDDDLDAAGDTLDMDMDEIAIAVANAAPDMPAEAVEIGGFDDTVARDLVRVLTDARPTIDVAAHAAAEPIDEPPSARTMHAELRGLSLAEQVKKAQAGDITERMILERIYGKNVWEALLRNPRLTAPEVARIARMGTLPRPMLELIVGNAGWLQIPEVRRALLSNPRLGTDQIGRVLRVMPKHELKLAASYTVYPFAVREAAKRLVRDA